MTNHNPKDTLSQEERAQMKRAFVDYMEMHPVYAPEPRRAALPSPYFVRLLHRPAFALMAFLFTLTGSAYAAETSLPDDFLYPVKTGIIEPLFIEAPAFTEAAEARANSKLITRRLEEARTLVDRNELSPETASYFAEEIEEHTTAVHAYVTEASHSDELSDAFAISTEVESLLEANYQVLAVMAEENGTENETVDALVHELEIEVDEAADAGDRLEQEAIATSAEEAKEFIAESGVKIVETVEALHEATEQLDDPADQEVAQDVEDLLIEAENSHKESQDALTAGNTQEAVEKTRDSLRAATRALIFIDAHEEASEEE